MTPFETSFTVTPERAGADGLCKLSALLYYCQEAAGGHCMLLGLDWDSLAKKDLFWALIRTRMEIVRLPKAGESVTVKTWPMPTTRTAFPRACEGRDGQGNILFRSTSLWVLMNKTSRMMLLPGKSDVTLEGIILGTEPPAPGSLSPIPGQGSVIRQVADEDLDRNGHMNNTRYMDWVWEHLLDSFPGIGAPGAFTACYLSEALPGQALTVSHRKEEDGCIVTELTRPRNQDPSKQERVFAAKVEFPVFCKPML